MKKRIQNTSHHVKAYSRCICIQKALSAAAVEKGTDKTKKKKTSSTCGTVFARTKRKKGSGAHTDTDQTAMQNGWAEIRAEAGRGRHVPPGLEMEMHPLGAEAGVTAGALVTRMFAWWHMAAWWRHVLLSRMHQRAVPCDFIIPFKFLSSSESMFSFLEVRCDYLQWSQSLAKWGSAMEGRGVDAAPLICLRPWKQSGVNITLPPSQDLFCTACFWKFQVMHKPGTSLLPL